MVAVSFHNFKNKILVVGPIYDQIDKVSNHSDWFSQHELIVFNGNLCYPFTDLDQIRQRLKIMDAYLAQSKVLYNLSDHDLGLMQQLWESGEAPDIHKWLQSKSNVVLVEFASQTNLTITGGGIAPNMTRSDLYDNLETSFINRLEGHPWHELYDGGCGYTIANNPLTQSRPTYYNHSMQIGTIYSPEITIYAVQVTSHGVGSIFSL